MTMAAVRSLDDRGWVLAGDFGAAPAARGVAAVAVAHGAAGDRRGLGHDARRGADLPAGVGAALLFACSLVLAQSVAAALDFIFASIMVLLEHSVYAMMKLRAAISALLSGAVIPALMPWGIGEVLGYLPFAALASAPLRIYTVTGDALLLLALQAAWAAVLWPLAHLMWSGNRERLVTHGG